MVNPLLIPAVELDGFCVRNGVAKLSIFGSRSKGTAAAGSDLDLLVEFLPGRVPGLISLSAMELELTQLMGGIKVDLRTPAELSSLFRNDVVRDAKVFYSAL